MASRIPTGAPVRQRPRSPHLFAGFLRLNYRWGPHMLISILHRATGSGMATVGTVLLVWWLAALAGGAGSYATFVDTFTVTGGGLNILGWIVGVGLTLSFFLHLNNGVRHLFMDTGALFELKRNKASAVSAMLLAAVFTAIFWLYMGMK